MEGLDCSWEVMRGLFSPDLAHRAGTVALNLIRHHEQLEAVQRASNFYLWLDDPGSFITIKRSSKTTDSNNTLRSNAAMRRYAAPLLEIISTVQELVPSTRNNEWAYIGAETAGYVVKNHSESLEKRRVVVGLRGSSLVTIEDPSTNQPLTFEHGPGDLYTISNILGENYTPMHSVLANDFTRVKLIFG
jgi:hypothetical protein